MREEMRGFAHTQAVQGLVDAADDLVVEIIRHPASLAPMAHASSLPRLEVIRIQESENVTVRAGTSLSLVTI